MTSCNISPMFPFHPLVWFCWIREEPKEKKNDNKNLELKLPPEQNLSCPLKNSRSYGALTISHQNFWHFLSKRWNKMEGGQKNTYDSEPHCATPRSIFPFWLSTNQERKKGEKKEREKSGSLAYLEFELKSCPPVLILISQMLDQNWSYSYVTKIFNCYLLDHE